MQLQDNLVSEHAEAEQAAKAAAKKVKKQRQKAKKQLSQAESMQPCDSGSGTSLAGPRLAKEADPEPPSPLGPSPESSKGPPSLQESHTAATAQPQTASHDASQDSLDADMLSIFRCPITKVSQTEQPFSAMRDLCLQVRSNCIRRQTSAQASSKTLHMLRIG